MTKVTAQAILRLPDGSSPLDLTPPSAEGGKRPSPSEKTFQTAMEILKGLGFEIGEAGSISITITGDKKTFENVFAIKLESAHPAAGETAYTLAEPFKVQNRFKAWLVDLLFPVAPQFFP